MSLLPRTFDQQGLQTAPLQTQDSQPQPQLLHHQGGHNQQQGNNQGPGQQVGQGGQGGQGGGQPGGQQRQPLRWPSELVQWAAQRREVIVHLTHCQTTETGFLAEVHRTHLTLLNKIGKKCIILADHVAMVSEV